MAVARGSLIVVEDQAKNLIVSSDARRFYTEQRKDLAKADCACTIDTYGLGIGCSTGRRSALPKEGFSFVMSLEPRANSVPCE